MSTGREETGTVLTAVVKALAAYGAASVAEAGRRAAVSLAGMLAVACLFATSLLFLTLAAYWAVAEALGSVYAALIAGCVYLMAGLIAALVLMARRR
ncbi:hypothetical protein [Reyranella sp.]|uniref:hypothetical protein n=1 Tax=Reyranella sp. TaxID=1929291 RepID=UPI003BAA0D20